MAGWVAGEDITADKLNDRAPFTLNHTAITANTAGATAETVWVTSPSLTFRNGRAYRFTVSALIQGNSADKATLRIRKTNTSGTVYLDTFHQGIEVTSSNNRVTHQQIATNTTGADVTAAIVGTFLRSSGSTANVLIAATATHVAYIMVEDIGPSSDYATAVAIS